MQVCVRVVLPLQELWSHSPPGSHTRPVASRENKLFVIDHGKLEGEAEPSLALDTGHQLKATFGPNEKTAKR